MDNERLPQNCFVLILLLATAKAIYDYQQLPDVLASHFNAFGTPNGWMSKAAFFVFYAAIVLMSALVGFVIPRRIAASPDSRLRLPNKDYWLAPERRAGTFAFFKRQFAWYGCALLALEVIVMEMAMSANLHAPIRLAPAPMLALILAFVGFNLYWVLQLHRRFSNTSL